MTNRITSRRNCLTVSVIAAKTLQGRMIRISTMGNLSLQDFIYVNALQKNPNQCYAWELRSELHQIIISEMFDDAFKEHFVTPFND